MLCCSKRGKRIMLTEWTGQYWTVQMERQFTSYSATAVHSGEQSKTIHSLSLHIKLTELKLHAKPKIPAPNAPSLPCPSAPHTKSICEAAQHSAWQLQAQLSHSGPDSNTCQGDKSLLVLPRRREQGEREEPDFSSSCTKGKDYTFWYTPWTP